MKLRLHLPLRAALMACYALAAPLASTLFTGAMLLPAQVCAADEVDDSTSLGNVMYVGDSITHGTSSSSYRWALHKIFADNGIDYTAVGYWDSCYSTDYNESYYGGVAYSNEHSAYASTRADDMLNGYYANNTSAISFSKVLDATDETIDNFFMMIGTNDFLSDYGDSYFSSTTSVTVNGVTYENGADFAYGESLSTLAAVDEIVEAMVTDSPDTNVTLLLVPTFSNEQAIINDTATYEAVALYNHLLSSAYDDEDNVTVVNTNIGLTDVTLAYETSYTTTDGETITYTVDTQMHSDMTYATTDAVHLSDQASLIVASNLAKALGYAGRTAGQSRMDAADFAVSLTSGVSNSSLNAAGFSTTAVTDSATGVTLSDGSSISYAWGSDATLTNGYTLDLSLDLGNGSTDGWDTTSLLAITMSGAGYTGTLVINEGYIMWEGNTADNAGNVIANNDAYSVLYSYDMSTLSDLGDLRIAYVAEDADNNLSGGYYVWIDDMLIGEALTASSYWGDDAGVTISYDGDGELVITSLAVDGTAAYAPTTTGITTDSGYVADYSNDYSGLISDWADGVSTEVSISSLSTDLAKTAGYDSSGTISITGGGTTSGSIYATYDAYEGDVWADITSGSSGNYLGAHMSGTHTGSIYVRVGGDFTGVKDATFLVQTGTVTGDVYMEFSAENATYGSYTSGVKNASVAASYTGSIGGTSTIVINDGSFSSDISGGICNSSSASIAGGTAIYINGGTMAADVVGAGQYGTIGTSGVTTTAVSVNINGGSIAGTVYGGSDNATTVYGNTSVTITGGSITGDVYGGGTGGTINGNTAVTIIGNEANISGNIYAGGNGDTITGTSTLTLQDLSASDSATGFDKYTGNLSGDALVLDGVRLDFFSATLSDFSSITAQGGSNVTLDGNDSISLSTVAVNEGSQLTLDMDSTIGTISISDGSTLTLGGTSTVTTWTRSQGSTLALADGAQVTIKGGAVNSTSTSGNTAVQVDFDIDLGNGATLSENAMFWFASASAGVTQTVNINGSGTYELTSLLLHYTDTGDVVLNVNDDATLHIITTKTVASDSYSGFVVSGAAGVNGNSYINISGTLELNSGITTYGTASGTITVQDGGTLELKRGTLSYSRTGGTITIDVEKNGTVDLGNTIDDSYNAASASDDLSVLTLNMKDGSTLYGTGVSFTADGFVTTDTTDVYQTLSIASGATVNLGTDAGKSMNIYSSIATGSLAITSGTVNLAGGATVDGISVASGATLGLGANVSSSSAIALNGGSINATTGSVDLAIAVNASSSLSSSTGALDLSSTITMAEGTSLNLSGAGDISLSSGFELVLDYDVASVGSYTIFTNASNDFSGDLVWSSSYDLNSDLYAYEWSYDNGTISLSVTEVTSAPDDEIWNNTGDGTFTGTDGDYTIDSTTGSTVDTGDTAVSTGSLEITGSGSVEITGAGLNSTDSITIGSEAGSTDVSISTGLSADKGMDIANGSVTVADGGAIAETNVTIANGSSLTAGNMTVYGTADVTAISMNEDGSITTDGISNTTINNAALTVTNTGNTISATSLENTEVSMSANSELSLSNVTISHDTIFALNSISTLGLATRTATNEGTLNLSDVTIEALSGSNLDVDGQNYTIDNIGSGVSATVEGTLTVNLVLSADEYSAFEAWKLGDADTSLVLTINGIDSYTEGSLLVITFSTKDEEAYYYVWGDFIPSGATGGSLVVELSQFNVIPEPSTATLSLLALTALLARRKRRASLR